MSGTPNPNRLNFCNSFLASFLASCPAAVSLANRLRDETGTRLWDLIDHVAVPADTVTDEQLSQLGFVHSPAGDHAWIHPQGMFPTIVADGRSRAKVALAVESVADFLAAHGMEDVPIAGEPFASLRKAKIDGSPVAELWVVERHGWRGFDSRPLSTHQLHALAHHAEAFRRRARHFQHAEHGFAHAQELVSRAVDDLGVDRACDLFFSAERQYWQRRNRAGQVQKGPPRPARPRLGQSRPPYLSLQPSLFLSADQRFRTAWAASAANVSMAAATPAGAPRCSNNRLPES